MNVRVLVSITVAVIALSTAVIVATASPKWEYYVGAVPDRAFIPAMDALGADGWELVTARRASTEDPSGREFRYEVIMKRRVSFRNPRTPDIDKVVERALAQPSSPQGDGEPPPEIASANATTTEQQPQWIRPADRQLVVLDTAHRFHSREDCTYIRPRYDGKMPRFEAVAKGYVEHPCPEPIFPAPAR